MFLILSSVIQFLVMFISTRILSIQANILGVLALTFVPLIIGQLIPGLTGLIIGFILFFIILKMIDANSGLFEVLTLSIVSSVVFVFVIKAVVAPMFNVVYS